MALNSKEHHKKSREQKKGKSFIFQNSNSTFYLIFEQGTPPFHFHWVPQIMQPTLFPQAFFPVLRVMCLPESLHRNMGPFTSPFQLRKTHPFSQELWLLQCSRVGSWRERQALVQRSKGQGFFHRYFHFAVLPVQDMDLQLVPSISQSIKIIKSKTVEASKRDKGKSFIISDW